MHTGRIADATGRVLMSVQGLVVAMLSVTGLMTARKRRAVLRGRQAASAASQPNRVEGRRLRAA